MGDNVERLRNWPYMVGPSGGMVLDTNILRQDCENGADEIERLREVIKAAREVAAMCRDAIDRDDDSPMRDIGRPEDQERVIRLERALAAYDNSSD